MYTTCAFCNAKLDGDGGPSGLGVGRRIAFDEWKGRLWVICPKCARWNLSPLDDRLERIDTVARAARDAKLLGIAANVAAGGSLGVFVWNLHRLGECLYITIVGNRKVNLSEPPICPSCGTLLELRAKHVQHARVVPDAHADIAVILSCPRCRNEAAHLTGSDAQAVLRQGLAYLNVTRAGRRRAADAAQVVDQAGGPDRLIRDVARRELTLRSLRPERRLALEMAVDEQAEVQELEREWRDAEELADIADGTLSSDATIEEELRRLKERGGNQPNG